VRGWQENNPMAKTKIISPTKQKVLLLLAGGLTLSLTRSPRRYWKMVGAIAKEWRFIERNHLRRLVSEFYRDRLVEYRDNNDGTSVVISEGGRRLLRRFDFDQIKLTPPARWDKHWRLVVFDIPEHRRAARVALREKLKELGFRELQKSVLIHPFPCQNEIDFLVEFFEIRPHVRLIEASAITNEAEWLLKFNLRK